MTIFTSRAPNNDNKTILVFTPHPDDELMGCGGSIKAMKLGHALHICYLINGDYREVLEVVRVKNLLQHPQIIDRNL